MTAVVPLGTEAIEPGQFVGAASMPQSDGTQRAPGVLVVTFEPGERAMVAPGAHIIVTAARRPEGVLAAARVAVGKNDLPPM